MPTVRFIGRVLPELIKVSLSDVDSINWGSNDLGFPIVMALRIQDSVVEVVCELDHYSDAYVSTLFARANDLARACINVASFSTGHGMLVLLDEIVRPDNTRQPIIVTNPALGALCTAYRIPAFTREEQETYGKVMTLVFQEPALLGSMNDLAQVLAFHHHTPSNCGRVLDSLRKSMAPESDPKRGWAIMQRNLNIDAAYMNWISGHSTKPRHGDHWTPLAEPVVTQIQERTWTVMNRFLEFRKRDSVALPLSEFPLLLG